MYSVRFGRPVVVTRHAADRMRQRHISEAGLLQLIDEGSVKYKDESHLWVWLEVSGRDDNMMCAVLVLEAAVVVKTVMHHWELMP